MTQPQQPQALNLIGAKNILIRAAEITNSKGAFSVGDAALVYKAFLFLKAEQDAIDANVSAEITEPVIEPAAPETPAVSTEPSNSTDAAATVETPADTPAPVIPEIPDEKSAINVLTSAANVGQKAGAFSIQFSAQLNDVFELLVSLGLMEKK